jgi:hypothetical protein
MRPWSPPDPGPDHDRQEENQATGWMGVARRRRQVSPSQPVRISEILDPAPKDEAVLSGSVMLVAPKMALALSPYQFDHPSRERRLSRKPLREAALETARACRCPRTRSSRSPRPDRSPLPARPARSEPCVGCLDSTARPSKMSLCLSPSTGETVPTLTPSEVITFDPCPICNHETGSAIAGAAPVAGRSRVLRHHQLSRVLARDSPDRVPLG